MCCVCWVALHVGILPYHVILTQSQRLMSLKCCLEFERIPWKSETGHFSFLCNITVQCLYIGGSIVELVWIHRRLLMDFMGLLHVADKAAGAQLCSAFSIHMVLTSHCKLWVQLLFVCTAIWESHPDLAWVTYHYHCLFCVYVLTYRWNVFMRLWGAC